MFHQHTFKFLQSPTYLHQHPKIIHQHTEIIHQHTFFHQHNFTNITTVWLSFLLISKLSWTQEIKQWLMVYGSYIKTTVLLQR